MLVYMDKKEDNFTDNYSQCKHIYSWTVKPSPAITMIAWQQMLQLVLLYLVLHHEQQIQHVTVTTCTQMHKTKWSK